MRRTLLILALFSLSACATDTDAVSDTASVADTVSDTAEAPLPFLDPPPSAAVAVTVGAAIAEVDGRFLSVAIDTSQVVGGNWWSESGEVEVGVGSTRAEPFDFTRERLRNLARELAPAYLRIGGSEADKVYYDMSDEPVAEAPEPFEFVFTKAQWDGVGTFAQAMGFDLMLTVNAGPGTRDEELAWHSDDALRDIVAYTVSEGYPVAVWELGNEVNGYPLFHGLDFDISGAQYAADLAVFKDFLAEAAPGGLVAGPSSAYWPVVGENHAIYPDFVAAGAGGADIITWHYYAQQSRRCPIASRPAGLEVMLDPANQAEIETWADAVEAPLDAGQVVWLGETGNAQCGGEPGVSETFAGSFWWLDQLGRIARRGQPVVVRQTLSGSNYGLMEDGILFPNPDYWASVLWKRLMGTAVLDVDRGTAADELAVYAHCAPALADTVSAVLVNASQSDSQTVRLAGLTQGTMSLWRVTAETLDARDVQLNGVTLVANEDGTLPALAPERARLDGTAAWVTLPPLSYAFVQVEGAGLAACP